MIDGVEHKDCTVCLQYTVRIVYVYKFDVHFTLHIMYIMYILHVRISILYEQMLKKFYSFVKFCSKISNSNLEHFKDFQDH